MKIIYEYKKEYYELLLNEENVDDNVIECIEKNSNKCDYDISPYVEEMNTDLLNFEQFICCKKKRKGRNGKRDGTIKLNDKYDENEEYDEEGGIRSCDITNRKIYLKYKIYFERKNYLVKQGDIYGADYLLYVTKEKYTHSLYAVYFIKKHNVFRDLIRILRLVCTIKKKAVLILQRDTDSSDISNNVVFVKGYIYKELGEKTKQKKAKQTGAK
ncbi:conserved Plasmodium protein, unknown function [Plasmodium malariae]|uniref:tRNA-intron lyase n=1 Tax=Plasmodium malariae TaxID=5858 RepID=A0A1A8WEP8_PLAMA|nr:conserved Plasmodium protein, unknown function [Plasmodium malariae]SBS91414.1 conserved Plasmodium protein, unknown function [Plasmodium malariae]SCP03751.1 conserved Plasmodium protein, unknown function [Plasmodium malariae]